MISRSRKTLKAVAFSVLGSAPMLGRKLSRVSSSGVLTILNLHRVDDAGNSAYEAMEPKLFDDLIGWLKKHFDIIRFADLADKDRQGKPKLILSFDDGYKDFIDVVVPILEKHGVRANQNVIPDCINTGLPPMNVMLQDFVGMAPRALLQELDAPWLEAPIDPDNRVASGMRASRIFKSKPFVEQRQIFEQLLPQMKRFDKFRPTPMMRLGEVSQVVSSHEIGAHSWSHASMEAEADDYFVEDLRRCRSYFSDQFGIDVNIYAFPNGSCRHAQIELALEEGIEHVLLVGEGFSTLQSNMHQRFTMYGNTPSELRFRAMGGFA